MKYKFKIQMHAHGEKYSHIPLAYIWFYLAFKLYKSYVF